jgi:hypothetical protein
MEALNKYREANRAKKKKPLSSPSAVGAADKILQRKKRMQEEMQP